MFRPAAPLNLLLIHMKLTIKVLHIHSIFQTKSPPTLLELNYIHCTKSPLSRFHHHIIGSFTLKYSLCFSRIFLLVVSSITYLQNKNLCHSLTCCQYMYGLGPLDPCPTGFQHDHEPSHIHLLPNSTLNFLLFTIIHRRHCVFLSPSSPPEVDDDKDHNYH